MDITQILNGLSGCIFDELTEYNVYDNVVSNLSKMVYSGGYDTGATKLVLYPVNSDIVVKIPLQGEGVNTFSSFEGATEPDHWDYCRVEAGLYQKAEAAHVEVFFAKTEFIGYVNGFPVYIQPKVEIFNETRSVEDYEEDLRENTKDTCNKLEVNCFNTCWLCDFLDYYGEDELLQLSQFLINNCIGDLHGGNLGYLEDGTPVIVDYSDYWE